MRQRRTAVLGPVAAVAVLALPLVLFFLAMPPARATTPPPGVDTALTIPVAGVPDPSGPPWAEVPPTVATTVPVPDPADRSPGWEQRWGEAALARLRYPWAAVGYSIKFAAAVPGLLGKTIPSAREIDIFVRPGESIDDVRHVVAHELGHAIDMSYNDASRRLRWEELRGIPVSLPWLVWKRTDYATPAGDFAETFAAWQVGDRSKSTVAPPPDGAQLAALVPLFFPPS